MTPSSSGGTYPSPSFSNVQEFFKGFIQSASWYSVYSRIIIILQTIRFEKENYCQDKNKRFFHVMSKNVQCEKLQNTFFHEKS